MPSWMCLMSAVLALGAAAGCSCSPVGPGPQDDHVVFSDLIAEVGFEAFNAEGEPADPIVIMAETDWRGMTSWEDVSFQMTDQHRSRLPQADASAFDAFEKRNAERLRLDAGRFDGINVVLFERSELDELFAGDPWGGWEKYYKRFPRAQGTLTLMRPGFSDDGTQAVIYYGNQSASAGGAGWIVLLEWNGKHWKIVEKSMLWIS